MQNDESGSASNSGSSVKKAPVVACDACHRKKVKCGEERPCGNCVSAGIECVTERQAKKRGPRTKEYMQSLKDRLEGLESRIRQRDQHMGDTPSLSPERTSSFEKHQQLPILDFASTSSAMATKKRRISLDEDEDEYVESRELRRLEQYVPATVSIMPRVNSEPLDIPLLDAYFEHVYPFMPLIHRRYFFQGSSLPAFLLKSMYAAACIYTSETERGKKFYQQARELVDQCMDSASLWTIHGLLSLVIYGGYLPSAPSTSSYLAMAIRMAQNLRLYRESSAPSPEIAHFPLRIQKEFRRRLWWFCYKCDRYSSAASGRPACIVESSVQIHLPAVEDIWEEGNYQLTAYTFEDEGTNMAVLSSEDSFCAGLKTQSVFNASLTLIKIYHKICKFVRDEEKRGLTVSADSKRQFVTLEASLNTWFESLPRDMQGPQDFHHARLDGRDPPHWMLAYFLMLYHSCIIELHRTRLRGLVSKTTLKSAIICEQSSGSITRLTSIFLLRNPRFFYVHPSIVRYLYEGAAIWLTLFSLVSDLSKRAEFNQQYLILKRALQGLSHHTGASTFLNMLNETQAGLGAGPAAILGAPAPVVTLGTSGTRAQSASDLSFFHQQHQVQRQQMLLTSNPGIASSRSHQRTSMSGIALNMKPFPLEPSPSNAVGIAMGSRPQMTSSIVGDSDQLLNFSDPASFLSTVANTTTSLFAEQDEPLRLFDDGMYGL